MAELKVSQRARDAAADLAAAENCPASIIEGFRNGMFDDNCRTQAFARFEQATSPITGEAADGHTVPGDVYESAVKGRQDFRQAYRDARNILTAEEWSVVASIGRELDLSEAAVLRQALRYYQQHHERLKAGEKVHWSGDEQRARDFAGPLAALPLAPREGWQGEVEREAEALVDANNRLFTAVIAAIDTGRSEPLFIVRDLLRNHLDERAALSRTGEVSRATA